MVAIASSAHPTFRPPLARPAVPADCAAPGGTGSAGLVPRSGPGAAATRSGVSSPSAATLLLRAGLARARFGHPARDWSGRALAPQLADRIRAFWRRHGYEVTVWLESVPGLRQIEPRAVVAVRSDLVNGLPRQAGRRGGPPSAFGVATASPGSPAASLALAMRPADAPVECAVADGSG